MTRADLLEAWSAHLAQGRRRSEHTVRPESAQLIYDQLGSKHKEILWLEKSGHIITLDEEREQVFAAVEKFLVERKDDE